MEVRDYLIRIARKAYRKLTGVKFYGPECVCDRQEANDLIYRLLMSGRPCMIARFGTVELNCINNYLCVSSKDSYFKKIKNYITDNTHTPWWNKDHFKPMMINAGIFPMGIQTAERFSLRNLEDIPLIDILACHQYYEKFMPLKQDVQRIQLEMLYPFFVERPWTKALKGKKVLIVHPFVSSIQKQYERKDLVFPQMILPEFELITLKAVQSAGNSKPEFSSWFEALNYMESKISKIDFDICILGCGAYGLPLAAFVKRMGRQAVHMGGATQLLFGIKGRRWLEDYKGFWHYRPNVDINIDYTSLFNDAWVFPSEKEKPAGLNKIENGCYW